MTTVSKLDASLQKDEKSRQMEHVVETLLEKSRAAVEIFDQYDESQGARKSRTQRLLKTEEDKALIRLALHRSSFFTCLDEEQIERFIQVAELRDFQEGSMIIREGEHYDDDSYYSRPLSGKKNSRSNTSSHSPTTYVYSIKSGNVEVLQQNISLCNLGPGEDLHR